jgi:hypothetical protein
MKHLSESELVDVAEGVVNATWASHLDACERCRQQVGAVRAALLDAKTLEVPEPSPLFWDHLSARVRQAVTNEPTPETTFWWRRPAIAVAWASALVLLVAIAVSQRPQRSQPIAPTPVAPASGQADDSPMTEPAADDQAWALLRAAAADLEVEDARAAGLTPRPGAVDRAVFDLTPAERDALGRLLQDELKRPGA